MKKKKYFAFFIMLALTYGLNAQLPTPRSGPPSPPGLAIDGGLIFLVVSGIIYGIKKVKK